MYLMCKDKYVYDIENDIVACKELLPGLMCRNPCVQSFEYWVGTRRAENPLADYIAERKYHTRDWQELDIKTRMSSLSDCYWLKEYDEPVFFKDISPYYHSERSEVASLYVNGVIRKEWKNGVLRKYGKQGENEHKALELCAKLGVSVAKSTYTVETCSSYDVLSNKVVDTTRPILRLVNFTTPDMLLEQANQTGRFNAYTFNVSDIFNYLGMGYGIVMLCIDAIVGNGDRHAGNFGWLRSTDTGKYLYPAPLYDFDHVLEDARGYLLADFLKAIKYCNLDTSMQVYNLLQNVQEIDTLTEFKDRAKLLLSKM